MMTMRRHAFGVVLIAAVAAMLFVAPLFRGEVFTQRDHSDYFQPLRWHTAQQLRAGELPLWNPYSAAGERWLANPQTGVFYPPTWLFVVLPFPTAYMLHLLLHLFILGWGMYALMSQMVSREAALVAAVAVVLGGPTLSLLDVQNNLMTFAWIPWAALMGIARRPVAGGVVLALSFLAGEPFLAAVAAFFFVAATFAAGRDGERARLASKAVAVCKAGVVAAGLSAIQLLPFIELVRGSDRAAGLSAELISHESMRPSEWLRAAMPPKAMFDPGASQHFILVVYVGAAVVGLSLLSLFVARRRKATWGWLAVLAAAVIVAGGKFVPLAGEAMAAAPVTLFRYPARVVPIGALALAALAAIGWDVIRPRRRWADLILIAVIAADLLPRVMPLLETAPFTKAAVPYPQTIGGDAMFMRLTLGRRGGEWIAGYLNLYDGRFDSETAAPVTAAAYDAFRGRALHGQKAALREALGVGYLLSERPMAPAYAPISKVRGVTVYRTPHASGLALFDSAPVRDVKLGNATARVVVDAPRPGTLVLMQQDAPGWRVSVDGNETSGSTAHGILRAVRVDRGRHEVVWRYRPASLIVGSVMTLITLAAMQISEIVNRLRARKFS